MADLIDRLTLSQRKFLFAVIAVGLVGFGIALWRISDLGPATPLPPAADAVTRSSPAPAASFGAPAAVEGLDADEEELALSDAELAAAQAVAEAFCVQYASRQWNELPDARLARLAPLMSDELAVAFASDAGSAALEDERAAVREVTTAQPEFAYPQTISRDSVVFTVVVLQTVTSTEGSQERRPSFQVVVEPRDGTWRVVNLVA